MVLKDRVPDNRELLKLKCRICGWLLGRTLDERVADLQAQGADPKGLKPSALAEWMNAQPHVLASIGKARVQHRDVQIHMVQRRKEQEENADAALVTGPNGKVMVSHIAKRFTRFVAMSEAVEEMFPDSMGIVKELQRAALEYAKRKEPIPKDLKDAWRIAKMNFELMEKTLNLIKGDATIQSVIKAQTINQTQNVIQGIPHEDLPRYVMESLMHLTCPSCGNRTWSKREALGAYAEAQAKAAELDIVDAEAAPEMPSEEDILDDPDGRYWDGELDSRR